MKYKRLIKKGTHFSRPFWRPIRFKPQTFVFSHYDLRYSLKHREDQADINKLIGMARPFRGSTYNSCMIGWSHDDITDITSFFLYEHIPTLRSSKNPTGVVKTLITSVGIMDTFNGIAIDFYKGKVTLTLRNGIYKDFVKTVSYTHPFKNFWYRMIFPYFGGNRTAPHDMSFEFTMENNKFYS